MKPRGLILTLMISAALLGGCATAVEVSSRNSSKTAPASVAEKTYVFHEASASLAPANAVDLTRSALARAGFREDRSGHAHYEIRVAVYTTAKAGAHDYATPSFAQPSYPSTPRSDSYSHSPSDSKPLVHPVAGKQWTDAPPTENNVGEALSVTPAPRPGYAHTLSLDVYDRHTPNAAAVWTSTAAVKVHKNNVVPYLPYLSSAAVNDLGRANSANRLVFVSSFAASALKAETH